MQLCAGERLESSKLGEVSELPALIMEIKVGWEKGRVIVEVPATRKIPIVLSPIIHQTWLDSVVEVGVETVR